MKLTKQQKQQIVNELRSRRSGFPSNDYLGVAVSLDGSTISKLLNESWKENTLSDKRWVALSRKLELNLENKHQWVTVETPTFRKICDQLKSCQEGSIGGLFCDEAGIGKSHAAKYYSKENTNAIYIDCSQCKTKQQLIKEIAREFGVSTFGYYKSVYKNVVTYLSTADKPLIIMDEFGDLDKEAFLEFKALWNATETYCGWYGMGADGMKVKFLRNFENRKVGYSEVFDRMGKCFQSIVPKEKKERIDFLKLQTAKVSKANGSTESVNKIYAKTEGSLRRAKIIITTSKQND